MNGQHLVPLLAKDTVFSPAWAYDAVVSAYGHELYGPEILMVRTLTLNTLTWARYRIAADMPYRGTDRRHRANRGRIKWG